MLRPAYTPASFRSGRTPRPPPHQRRVLRPARTLPTSNLCCGQRTELGLSLSTLFLRRCSTATGLGWPVTSRPPPLQHRVLTRESDKPQLRLDSAHLRPSGPCGPSRYCLSAPDRRVSLSMSLRRHGTASRLRSARNPLGGILQSQDPLPSCNVPKDSLSLA